MKEIVPKGNAACAGGTIGPRNGDSGTTMVNDGSAATSRADRRTKSGHQRRRWPMRWSGSLSRSRADHPTNGATNRSGRSKPETRSRPIRREQTESTGSGGGAADSAPRCLPRGTRIPPARREMRLAGNRGVKPFLAQERPVTAARPARRRKQARDLWPATTDYRRLQNTQPVQKLRKTHPQADESQPVLRWAQLEPMGGRTLRLGCPQPDESNSIPRWARMDPMGRRTLRLDWRQPAREFQKTRPQPDESKSILWWARLEPIEGRTLRPGWPLREETSLSVAPSAVERPKARSQPIRCRNRRHSAGRPVRPAQRAAERPLEALCLRSQADAILTFSRHPSPDPKDPESWRIRWG